MNSDIFLKVILAVLETFAFFGIGAFIVMRKMLDKDSIKGMSSFAINVLTPFLIFSSVAGNFTKEDLSTAWIYPVLGFAMMILHCILGYLLLAILRNDSEKRKATFLHMAVVNNYLYLPLIVVGYIWGGKTTAALLLWSVGSTFGQWTIGIAVMAGNDVKRMLRTLVSANSIAVIAAVLYLLQPFRLPSAVMNFVTKT
ncbi:MAG: AEC family transporter, partial [Lentisphaeria bacterium]|nr:AEC family transporter [Lentisphaeria bacterium]